MNRSVISPDSTRSGKMTPMSKMYLSSGISMPRSTRAVILGAPGVPFLVKIWITPVAASDPKRVEAAPPLVTSMRSMSLTSRSESAEDCSPPVPAAVDWSLSTRTPST